MWVSFAVLYPSLDKKKKEILIYREKDHGYAISSTDGIRKY